MALVFLHVQRHTITTPTYCSVFPPRERHPGLPWRLPCVRKSRGLISQITALFLLHLVSSLTSSRLSSPVCSFASLYARTMAEIIGIISSAIAFGQAIEGFARGAPYIAAIRGAPAAFVDLQNEVRHMLYFSIPSLSIRLILHS